MKVLILYAAGYLAFLFLLKRWKSEIFHFKLPKSTGLIPIAISLLLAHVSINTIGIMATMLHEQGIAGYWFVCASFLGVGLWYYWLIPLWSQLRFENENEFILLRFQGVWAKRLFFFRGLYVGIVINACIVSLAMIAFSDIGSALTGIDKWQFLLFSSVFLLINVFRNTLENKLNGDLLNFLVLLSITGLGLALSGWEPVLLKEVGARASSFSLNFPYSGDEYFLHTLSYVGLLWWSAELFDGSGVVSQRIMGQPVKKAQRAFLLFVLLNMGIFLLIAYLCLKAFEMFPQSTEPEMVLYQWMTMQWPEYTKIISLILLFKLFTASTEAHLNWAGSLVDSLKLSKKRQLRYWNMAAVALLAVLIAFYFQRLQSVVYMIFGLGAGTSLIFILRWFTPKINAQVQLAVMLGAVVFSILGNLYLSSPYHHIPPRYHFLFLLWAITFLNLALAFFVYLFTYDKKEDVAAYAAFRSVFQWPKTNALQISKAISLSLILSVAAYQVFKLLLSAN